MTDKKKASTPSKVTVVMSVNSHGHDRNEKVEVSREVADRLIANHQAREA